MNMKNMFAGVFGAVPSRWTVQADELSMVLKGPRHIETNQKLTDFCQAPVLK